MITFTDVQPGDLVETYMDSEGRIGDGPYDGPLRKFEILAVGVSNNVPIALLDYKQEELFKAENFPSGRFETSAYFCDIKIIKKKSNLDYYKNNWVRWIKQTQVHKITKSGPDGCNCDSCKEFYPMAVPNQPNNTLICWSCRQNPLRKYY